MLVSRREYGLGVLLTLIITIVSIRNPRFLMPDTVLSIFGEASQTAIIACGVMLVIVTGEIDISVGSALGFLIAILGTMVAPAEPPIPGWGWPVWVGILLTLTAGALIGLINGLLVTLVRIPSIIVTLAMLMGLRAMTRMIISKGELQSPDALYRVWGTGKFLFIPVPVWIMFLVVAATWILVRYTPIGRRIYAVGSNSAAAALSGISVARVKIFAFTLTGLFVAIAAVITQVSKFNNGLGEGKELLVVTCIVVGGVSISGGTGTVIGVLLGTLLLQSQNKFLIFLDIGKDVPKWDKAIQGGLILAAVLIDHIASRRRAARGGGGH
jgi:ribose/xylose/arabinose/galactoside ABC-type transport system permease subunit